MVAIVGLDIGTSFIRVVVGELLEDDSIRIIGTSCEKSAGLRNGNIVNIVSTATAIKNAIDNAEQVAGVEISSCFVSVGGDQIESQNAMGKVGIPLKGRSQQEISQSDIARVIDCATAVQLAMDREKLHVAIQEYIVDGVHGIKDPVHMLGVCLEAAVHIITASKTTIQNIYSCIGRAGYDMDGVKLKTLAAQEAVTTPEESELGSIIIDLGAGTTDVLVVMHDAPVYTTSIPIGGNMVTNDIAIVEGIPVVEAEQIKIDYGCCWMDNVNPDATVIISGVGGRPPEEIMQTEICEIIQSRMEEIFTMIRNKISEKTTLTQLAGNIILVGGGACMEGIIELAQDVFGTSAVRIGVPEKLDEKGYNCDSPEWATAIGLVISGKEKAFENKKVKKRVSSPKKSGKDNIVKKIFKSLF